LDGAVIVPQPASSVLMAYWQQQINTSSGWTGGAAATYTYVLGFNNPSSNASLSGPNVSPPLLNTDPNGIIPFVFVSNAAAYNITSQIVGIVRWSVALSFTANYSAAAPGNPTSVLQVSRQRGTVVTSGIQMPGALTSASTVRYSTVMEVVMDVQVGDQLQILCTIMNTTSVLISTTSNFVISMIAETIYDGPQGTVSTVLNDEAYQSRLAENGNAGVPRSTTPEKTRGKWVAFDDE